MTTPGPILRYLAEFERALQLAGSKRQRILQEVRDHLVTSAMELREQGVDPVEAERIAVKRFGDARAVALRFRLDVVSRIRRRLFGADEGNLLNLRQHVLNGWVLLIAWIATFITLTTLDRGFWRALLVAPALAIFLLIRVWEFKTLQSYPEATTAERRRALVRAHPRKYGLMTVVRTSAIVCPTSFLDERYVAGVIAALVVSFAVMLEVVDEARRKAARQTSAR